MQIDIKSQQCSLCDNYSGQKWTLKQRIWNIQDGMWFDGIDVNKESILKKEEYCYLVCGKQLGSKDTLNWNAKKILICLFQNP